MEGKEKEGEGEQINRGEKGKEVEGGEKGRGEGNGHEKEE